MSKTLTIKLTKATPKMGPFDIYTDRGDLVAENVSKKQLILGVHYVVNDDVNIITINSKGDCPVSKNFSLTSFTSNVYYSTKFQQSYTGCIWRHLTNICLLYTSPSPRDGLLSRMPSSA